MNDRQVALADCPFCGSMKIDPEGWTSLEQYKSTEQWRSGPACEECGASAETVEKWNTRSRTPSAPDVAMREALEEIWCLREVIRGVRIMQNAGAFKEYEGEPWLKRVQNINIDVGFDRASEAKAGEQSDQSQAKATEGKAGMAVVMDHVRRSTAGTGLLVGEAVAVQPATSEIMDVTAGETAPQFLPTEDGEFNGPSDPSPAPTWGVRAMLQRIEANASSIANDAMQANRGLWAACANDIAFVLAALTTEETAPTPPQVDLEAVARLVGMVRALLKYTNPTSVAEDHSQQWQAVDHECDRILSLLAPTAPAQEGE